MTGAEQLEALPGTPGETATKFLRWLDPVGTHNLVALHPETGMLDARTFAAQDHADIAPWVDARAGRLNIYYTANEVRADLGDRKPTKADVLAIRAIYTDVDPLPSVDLEAERARIVAKLRTDPPLPFAAVIDSGGGFQALAVLADKLDTTPDAVEWAETHGRGLAHALGADSVQNVDRLLRLPGPDNLPSEAKRAKGRVRRAATVIDLVDDRTTRDAISRKVTPADPPAGDDTDADVTEAIADITHSGYDCADTYADLSAELKARFDADLTHDPALAKLWQTGAVGSEDKSGSALRFKLAGILKRLGGYDADAYASLAWVWPLAVQRGDDRASKLSPRQLGRDWGRAKAAGTAQPDLADAFFKPEQVPGPGHEARRAGLPLMSFDEVAESALEAGAEPLVEGLLDVGAASVLYGPSNVGKTFVVLDMAHAIATGRPWSGRATTKSGVLYLALEGGGGIKKRFAALRKDNGGAAPTNFALSCATIDLCSSTESAQDIVLAARSLPGGCGLIVIDTMARAMNGGDENSGVDVGKFVANVDRIRQATGAHVLIIHHSGKDTARGARGHSSLRAAVDTELEIQKGTISNPKQRDHDLAEDVAFSLEAIALGADAKGRTVWSAVVRTRKAADAAAPALQPTASETRMLDAVRALIAGSPPSPCGPKPADVAAYLAAAGQAVTEDNARKQMSSLDKKGWLVKANAGPAKGSYSLAPVAMLEPETSQAAGLSGGVVCKFPHSGTHSSPPAEAAIPAAIRNEDGMESGISIFG
ncbi:helicase RepA family protein [Paracoccus sediminilitoris]|uniref:helicase RepA family protein n=1 Tax=Paracoccus sediminilitoris TaxID=2202419 RepID=UPI00272ABC41|nr:helicase RepA family protein [Paracoccus sediminilitoris]